jgi:hypothetical protein
MRREKMYINAKGVTSATWFIHRYLTRYTTRYKFFEPATLLIAKHLTRNIIVKGIFYPQLASTMW